MNVIREYSAINDRKSKDCKDRSKKANAWKEVASRAKLEACKAMAQSNANVTAFFAPFSKMS